MLPAVVPRRPITQFCPRQLLQARLPAACVEQFDEFNVNRQNARRIDDSTGFTERLQRVVDEQLQIPMLFGCRNALSHLGDADAHAIALTLRVEGVDMNFQFIQPGEYRHEFRRVASMGIDRNPGTARLAAAGYFCQLRMQRRFAAGEHDLAHAYATASQRVKQLFDRCQIQPVAGLLLPFVVAVGATGGAGIGQQQTKLEGH